MPSTWVPIPLVQRRCEKNCCSIEAMPLMICKSLSIHKSQGMTVGQGKPFTKVVVYLPPSGNKCPGLELVAVSRAVALNDFAVGNTETELTRQTLSRIGNTNAYKARKEFLQQTRARSEPSQEFTKLAITALDPAALPTRISAGALYVVTIILATTTFIPHNKAASASFAYPPFLNLSFLSATYHRYSTFSATLLTQTFAREAVTATTCPPSSHIRPKTSLAVNGDSNQSMKSKESAISTAAGATGYLNAKDAASLDAELMSTPGFSLEQLMELAGLAVAEAVYSISQESVTVFDNDTDNDTTKKHRVLLVCGPGNNGGDGLVAARHLVHFGLQADIVYPKPSSKQHFINLIKQCRDMGIPITDEVPTIDAADNKYDIIVDAIFGFSFDSKSTIREPFASSIGDMIQLQKEYNTPMISVDVPSGWDVDGGDLTGMNFKPDVLISLTAPKLSAKKFRGRHFVGGRFLPPEIAKKYGIQMPSYPGVSQMPPYPGLRHCMEITNEPVRSDEVNENTDDDEDWAAQYQAYLDEQDALKEDETVEKTETQGNIEGEDWAVQYAEYCMEKEKEFFETNPLKHE
eukprot:scaffold13986_cov58-Cyclotella_meneghiniana.AAC.3